jgi:MIP family channel proteins
MTARLSHRCIAEALGTFAIVFFGCGSIALIHGQLAGLPINLIFGLTVGTMIYALGHISAAHFNPAVTIGFAVSKRFPWRDVLPYIVAQVIGAIAASVLHAWLIADKMSPVNYGSTLPVLGMHQVLHVEAILTFFLMLVIISVATDNRAHPAIPGLAIGGFVALAGMFGGPLTGCSMNPARSLGPALLAGGPAIASYWLYIVGPVVGACLAVFVYEAIRKEMSVQVLLEPKDSSNGRELSGAQSK